MRFHVCALPHTNTTYDYLACAFTTKVINFCRMMTERGHEVFLYSGETNEAPCTEHIPCVSEEDRKKHVGVNHYTAASFDARLPFWKKTNAKMAEEIKKRAHQTDFICIIGGTSNKDLIDALPGMLVVEFGIGYGGTISKYRVFESYAWMHTVYGSQSPHNPNAVDGGWWDAVIPGFVADDQYPFSEEKDDYFFFIGRLTERKGYNIALQVAGKLGKKLIVAGPGTPPENCEYRGVVGVKERGELMSRAKAVFVPTIYVEPFGMVNVEAQACGTPVITTDWGAFTETVIHGKTGFRCRTFSEFVEAAEKVDSLDYKFIRDNAISNYGLGVTGKRYEEYFSRLGKLWDQKGWYAE